MRFEFFAVPVVGGEAIAKELNSFLASHRVVQVERVLVPDGPRSLWAVCVSWTTTTDPEVGRPRPSGDRKPVDYRETLPQADFELYRRLRDWRQTTSKGEGLAPYLPLNNEQLAEIARRRPVTLAALGEIDGIGPSKLSKYGVGLLAVVAALPTEEPSNATNKPTSA